MHSDCRKLDLRGQAELAAVPGPDRSTPVELGERSTLLTPPIYAKERVAVSKR